jgi:hypothetical protein
MFDVERARRPRRSRDCARQPTVVRLTCLGGGRDHRPPHQLAAQLAEQVGDRREEQPLTAARARLPRPRRDRALPLPTSAPGLGATLAQRHPVPYPHAAGSGADQTCAPHSRLVLRPSARESPATSPVCTQRFRTRAALHRGIKPTRWNAAFINPLEPRADLQHEASKRSARPPRDLVRRLVCGDLRRRRRRFRAHCSRGADVEISAMPSRGADMGVTPAEGAKGGYL